MQRDVEKVQEIYEAFSQQDLEAILMLMSQDVEVIQSPELPWGGVYRGHDGARQFLSRLAEHLENRVEIECLIDAGDHVAAVGRTVGKARATGLEFDVPVVHIWALSEGLVTRFEPYVDNPTLLAALGL